MKAIKDKFRTFLTIFEVKLNYKIKNSLNIITADVDKGVIYLFYMVPCKYIF